MRSGPSVNARFGFRLRRRVGHGKTKRVNDEPLIAYVALGANLGAATGTLREAADSIGGWSLAKLLGSSLWRTAPVDCPPDSPPFLNAALGLQPTPGTTPESLLDALLALEARLGRTRSGLANAPRAIDLDLIAFGTETRTTPTLVLPHPRAHERAFVLAPLSEIAPGLVLPGQQQTVSGLLATLGQTEVTKTGQRFI
jgi:2-amino-4-hydroxy-6-hydroxymethyldihydropteridine diphosphokinase